MLSRHLRNICFKIIVYLKRYKILVSIILILTVFYYFSLSKELFPKNYSTEVLDANGELIGARIASDGQWRFPEDSVVPEKFKQCVIQFEDKHFYHHFGFNPVSLGRAFVQNIKAHKVVSGGSTITM